MHTSQPVALDCRITRGGFSDERIFRVPQSSGDDYQGIASRRYCWGPGDRLLAENEPPSDEKWIKGKVAARVIGVRGDDVQVSVPDGEVITVSRGQLRARPNHAHVPV